MGRCRTGRDLAKLTPAQVTQIMNLLGLDPDIQEEIFSCRPVTEGRPAITEPHLRAVLKTVVWSEQWAALRAARSGGQHRSLEVA